jgi:ATP-dependent DNA helicase UvrD/PcrA
MKELRIMGPPGTGKTGRLATEEIPNAVNRFGSDKVVVTSFTRAGAREIATKRSAITGEAIHVDREHVGTLHALCFRRFGQPELAEKHIDKWNEEYPYNTLSPKAFDTLNEDGIGNDNGSQMGDVLMNKLCIYRAKMTDRKYWSQNVQRFDAQWTDFKNQINCVDFTDLIENAVKDLPYAPGQPDVIFVDEAQDFTRLQLSLVRRWGEEAQWIVLVGDDDQTIYGFAGATPDAFLNPPIDKKFKRILDQSYRVPASVLRMSERLIQQVSVREEKKYMPRKEDGETVEGSVERLKESYKTPNMAIEQAKQYWQEGKTVMFLASCSYMLNPLRHALREKGIPFWNPYRKTRGDWNPLRGGGTTNTSRDMIVNFVSSGMDEQYWDIHQFVSWAEHLKVQPGGLIRKNGNLGIKALKKAIKNGQEGLHTSRNVLGQILTPEAVHHAMDRDVEWLVDNIKIARQKALAYPIKVYQEFNESAIIDQPKIIIGTIHSVKGGEADCVFLYPDISFKTYKALHTNRQQTKDELYRLFYVGMTRTKEKLIVMDCARQKGSAYFVNLIF